MHVTWTLVRLVFFMSACDRLNSAVFQICSFIALVNKHCISKTKEPVPLLDRLLICIQDVFPSCECGHEHDKRGFRKVEVCDQAIQDLKLVSRIDKDLSPAASGFQDPVIAGCRFQGEMSEVLLL